MSYLILNSSSQLFRLGFVNAAKILTTSTSVSPTSSSLFQASGNGRAFTAKYYHALSQKKDRPLAVDGPFAITSLSSTLRNNKALCSRLMSSEGDHVKLWTAERILSAGLVPLIPMALLMPCAPFDYMVAFALTVHSHWGIEAIVVDYVRPSVFGNVLPKIALGLVYGLSAMTLGGLFYFIYADVGIANAIRMLWKL